MKSDESHPQRGSIGKSREPLFVGLLKTTQQSGPNQLGHTLDFVERVHACSGGDPLTTGSLLRVRTWPILDRYLKVR
jgi:hypothetical protein